MGYINNNLMSSEQVVYRTKEHWMIFVCPILFVITFI
jgi:hypothetical protein